VSYVAPPPALLGTLLACGLLAAPPLPAAEPLPVLLNEDFEAGAERWEPTDADAWKVIDQEGNRVYSLHGKSRYKPPHRSPRNIALLKDVTVGDFELTAKVQSTIKDYNHRDMCLFFGYQDAGHFYYVHLGKKTDDHANQIFIVNGAARTKISTRTTSGTPWNDAWHEVKIVRDVASGLIEVYYDDTETPAMTASDKTFAWGRVGLGSFDDTGNWDDVRLRGNAAGRNGSSAGPKGDTGKDAKGEKR